MRRGGEVEPVFLEDSLSALYSSPDFAGILCSSQTFKTVCYSENLALKLSVRPDKQEGPGLAVFFSLHPDAWKCIVLQMCSILQRTLIKLITIARKSGNILFTY